MGQVFREDPQDEVTKPDIGGLTGLQGEPVAHGLQMQPVSCEVRDLLVNNLYLCAVCDTAAGLQRDIAIKSVNAWRLMVLTLLELELLFTAPELDFLRDYAREYGVEAPDHLGAAMRSVPHFGGRRGSRQDRPPGRWTIWRGYERLTTATVGHLVRSRCGGRSRTES